jgi:hypothetical protein
MAELWIDEGAGADDRLARFFNARERDPDISGFGAMTSHGPRDLVATEAIRARFFGEAGPETMSPA